MARKNGSEKLSANEFTQEQKHREFARQYILDFKAIAAYRRCNFKVGEDKPGDSAAASKLLANPAVQNYISELVEARRERFEVRSDSVVRELARIAFSDITSYFTWENGRVRLKDSAMLDENASRAVERLDVVEYESPSGRTLTRTKLKLYSKTQALDLLAKHLGMYTEKHEITHTIGNGLSGLLKEAMTVNGHSPS